LRNTDFCLIDPDFSNRPYGIYENHLGFDQVISLGEYSILSKDDIVYRAKGFFAGSLGLTLYIRLWLDYQTSS